MITLKRILCPVDFSMFSRQALVRAAALAVPQRAVITALHVVPLPAPIFVPQIESATPTPVALVPGDRAHLLRALADFTAPATARGAAVEIDVVEAPTVHAEILAQADRLGADLIVMGSHGRSGFQRLFLGSVTEKVLRTARQAVMTVGASAAVEAKASASFRHIVCGVDFSDCSLAALRYALTLGRDAGAHVTVVNVVEWAVVGYDPLAGSTDLEGFRIDAERIAREHLRDAVAGVGAAGVNVEQTVCSGRAHHEILRLAAAQHADLIVLGIHGRNPVARLLFGSTAEPVVRRAACPVLTVRMDAEARTAAA